MDNVIAYVKANPKKAGAWVFAVLAALGLSVSPELRDLVLQALPILAGAE